MWSITLDRRPARILSFLASDVEGGGGGLSGVGSWAEGTGRFDEEERVWGLAVGRSGDLQSYTYSIQLQYLHRDK